MTPTQRSLKLLRDEGVIVEKVEQRLPIPGKFVTRDLFNVFDLVAIFKDKICGVQVTSGSNVSARLAKIQGEPAAATWIRAGGSIHVHGWRKVGKRGERKAWACRLLTASLLPDGEQILWTEN